MKIRLFIFAIIALSFSTFGQLITWTPYFATDTDSIVVTFDATQGNAGLAGYTGDVYAHTGVITNLSTGLSNWKYVKTNWGVNTPETKLTRIGTNLYQFSIKPSVRSFYGVPPAETIQKIAFVFRSALAPFQEGKTAEGGDIFLDMANAGLNAAIVTPSKGININQVNDTVKISALAFLSTQFTLYANNVLITQTSGTSINYNYISTSTGKTWFKVVATNGSNTKADSVYVVTRPNVTSENPPGNIVDGINYTGPTSATLSIYAPYKQFAYVIGEFNNWEVDPNYYMKRSTDGKRFWITINNLSPAYEYSFQYLIDGTMRVADPYADKILDPWNDSWINALTYPGLKAYPTNKTSNIVSVLQTAQSAFNWQTTGYQKPAKTDLVIYEILIRDFIEAHTYKALMDTIGYLKNLGVNAIQLMPVMDFEGNESWGYNPMFKFAPDKYYGLKNQLKGLIDRAHQNGIAVILDIVLNHHFGLSPLVRLYWDAVNNKPSTLNPWFNPDARHPYSVGYDFNHESQETKNYVDRVCKYWMTEYKVDGFRFDLSKGFTQTNSGSNVGLWGQYDQSRINLLKRMADQIWITDPTAYVILEHFADNSEETVLANYGMMLWGNMNYSYSEATMGYTSTSDISWASYKARNWQQPNLVTYMESHDEERLMYKNLQYGNSSGTYNIKNLNTALNRMKLAGAFFFTIPGPKQIWQFGELGYDFSINYPTGTSASRTDKKPIKWDYYGVDSRRNVYKTYKALIHLKNNYDVFRTTDFALTGSGAIKKLHLNHSSMKVVIVGNFDVVSQNATPSFQNTGVWYSYFNNDSITVNDIYMQIPLGPGEFKIYTTVKLPDQEQNILTELNEDESSIVTDFALLQNFPNPFNPSTTITYDIRNAGFVSLKVYDMIGNEVATLISEEQAQGRYSVDFNAGNLASGVYFYKLQTGDFSAINKMLLLK
ncbi:MAG: alpha-amylase family glycosyl hydrolase [Ignavibacteriaceae bacterium]